MISLEVMRTFVAVVDRGSVVDAARVCGYSPAAISRQMSAFQRGLGVRLFEPAGRGIRSTPIAEELAASARALLLESARFEVRAREVCRNAANTRAAVHMAVDADSASLDER